jgi:hypothetical protein
MQGHLSSQRLGDRLLGAPSFAREMIHLDRAPRKRDEAVMAVAHRRTRWRKKGFFPCPGNRCEHERDWDAGPLDLRILDVRNLGLGCRETESNH